MNKKGITLIELLIVLAIIGFLAAIAVPAYIGQQKKATRSEAFINLENLRLLEEQYFAEHGQYTGNLGTCNPNNDNIAAIQAVIPGFRPGTGLSFSYCIEQNIDVKGKAQTPCFRASAFGNNNTRVTGETFRIDCNNNKENY